MVSALSLWISFISSERQGRAATYTAIMDRLFEINRLEIERAHLFQLLYKPFHESDVAEGGYEGLGHYCFMVLNSYEEVYSQCRNHRQLTEEQLETWRRRLVNDFRTREFWRGYWEYSKQKFPGDYTREFMEFVDGAKLEAMRDVALPGAD